MTPYYQDKWATIYFGDCREILPSLSGGSAIVTDPPYELGFMGKTWDSQGVSFQKETWEIIRKSCLPGAPLLSFGGSRTQHRIACAIEDAGWEIRDTLMWVYGSGFPKSLDISKAIDKHGGNNERFDEIRNWLRTKVKECNLKYRDIDTALGNENSHKASHYLDNSQPQIPTPEDWAILKTLLGVSEEIDHPPRYKEFEREVIGKHPHPAGSKGNTFPLGQECDLTLPATPEAQLWEGYGTALKPAYEPIILAMNPLDGTFANNALKHKVAGLNIDGCRIGTEPRFNSYAGNKDTGFTPADDRTVSGKGLFAGVAHGGTEVRGRFPANFLHDGSQMVMELFPNSGGCQPHRIHSRNDKYEGWGSITNKHGEMIGYEGNGSAARFFYCAKASRAERDAGCEDLEAVNPYDRNSISRNYERMGSRSTARQNNHPTVKPLALMEYLCKLVKMPEYNLILDPFCGSGTTLLACIKLGIPCIGIDSDEQSCEIAARRCSQEVMELVA